MLSGSTSNGPGLSSQPFCRTSFLVSSDTPSTVTFFISSDTVPTGLTSSVSVNKGNGAITTSGVSGSCLITSLTVPTCICPSRLSSLTGTLTSMPASCSCLTIFSLVVTTGSGSLDLNGFHFSFFLVLAIGGGLRFSAYWTA